MRCVFPKLNRTRVTAILLAAIGVLVTVYSVQPTASRFDASAQRSGFTGAVNSPAGAPPGAIPRVEPFFDYSVVFPEQPSASAP